MHAHAHISADVQRDQTCMGVLSCYKSSSAGKEGVLSCCVCVYVCPMSQAASEQRPHKISYVLQPFTASTPNATDPAYDTSVEPPKRVVQRLAEELKDKGIKAKVIFSGE